MADIESVLNEVRVFDPPAAFVSDPEGFWAEQAEALAGVETIGDTTTLEDDSVLVRLREEEE